MLSARNLFRKLTTSIKPSLNNSQYPLQGFIHAAQTVTSTATQNTNNLYESNITQNIFDRLKDFSSICPVKNEIVVSEVKHTEQLYYEQSLKNVIDLLNSKKYLQAKEQANKVVSGLEKIKEKLSKNESSLLDGLMVEAYILQGDTLQFGSASEDLKAVEAYGNALKINPTHKKAKEKRDSLLIDLGGTPEGQTIEKYGESKFKL